MSKFDEISPNAIRGTRLFLENGDEVAKVSDGKTHPCWNCEEKTDWADFYFEAYFCSEECLREKTAEYVSVVVEQDGYIKPPNNQDTNKRHISSDTVE